MEESESEDEQGAGGADTGGSKAGVVVGKLVARRGRGRRGGGRGRGLLFTRVTTRSPPARAVGEASSSQVVSTTDHIQFKVKRTTVGRPMFRGRGRRGRGLGLLATKRATTLNLEKNNDDNSALSTSAVNNEMSQGEGMSPSSKVSIPAVSPAAHNTITVTATVHPQPSESALQQRKNVFEQFNMTTLPPTPAKSDLPEPNPSNPSACRKSINFSFPHPFNLKGKFGKPAYPDEGILQTPMFFQESMLQ